MSCKGIVAWVGLDRGYSILLDRGIVRAVMKCKKRSALNRGHTPRGSRMSNARLQSNSHDADFRN